jgi:hypothetical protein
MVFGAVLIRLYFGSIPTLRTKFFERNKMNNYNYNEVKQFAQSKADETGFDYGIEKLNKFYSVFMLPAKKFRFGRDSRCEVVYCTKLEKCAPGHGPNT